MGMLGEPGGVGFVSMAESSLSERVREFGGKKGCSSNWKEKGCSSYLGVVYTGSDGKIGVERLDHSTSLIQPSTVVLIQPSTVVFAPDFTEWMDWLLVPGRRTSKKNRNPPPLRFCLSALLGEAAEELILDFVGVAHVAHALLELGAVFLL